MKTGGLGVAQGLILIEIALDTCVSSGRSLIKYHIDVCADSKQPKCSNNLTFSEGKYRRVYQFVK